MKTSFPLIALEDEYVCSDCRSTEMLETQEKDGDIYRYYVMCKECGRYLEIQKYTDGRHQCPISHCQSTIVLEVRERKDKRYNDYLLCNNCSFIFGGDAVKTDSREVVPPEQTAESAASEEPDELPVVEAVTDILITLEPEAEFPVDDHITEDLFARHKY